MRKKPGRAAAITTRDIARASGVSTATVSYVLSGRSDARVSLGTRGRVMEAAQQLGYRRNSLAAALRTGRMYTVGIVGPFTADGSTTGSSYLYVRDLVLATTVAAARAGLNAVLFVEQSITDLPAARLADRRIDGAVLFGLYDAGDWATELFQTGLVCVEIGSSYGLHQVHADNYQGAGLAAGHLLDLGHRKIGHWRGVPSVVSAQRRLDGFLDTVRAAGLPAEDTPVFNSADEFVQLIRRPNSPTAFFVYNDELAVQALDLLAAEGLRVPQDVSLVGFDNNLLAETMRPRLTTVQNPLDAMAAAAVRLVLQQLDPDAEPETPLPVPTSLVVRHSTAPPAARRGPSRSVRPDVG